VIGFIAAAIATTVAGWSMFALLWWKSRSMGAASDLDARAKARIGRIVLASLVMGLGLWAVNQMITPSMLTGTRQFGILAVLVLFGMGLYAIAGVMLGAFRPSDLSAVLRRQR
ncbi:MAG: lipid II flippase MurJ, partial [Boseongicola sp.]|nr:lipid II flippase MurJ [Boseongicola sp.]NNJ68173.1 lipid II flippase MurJ [Boseongicola sp.]